MPFVLPVLVTTGICVGFFSGLLGIGGGIFMVPLLIKLYGVETQQAIGISLLVIVPTAFAGAFRHYGNTEIDIKVVFILALSGMIGAYFGAATCPYLSNDLLKKIFGIALVLVGINMLFDWTEKDARAAYLKAHPETSDETPANI